MLNVLRKIKQFIVRELLFLNENEISDVYKLERFKEKVIINVAGRFITLILLAFGIVNLLKNRYILSVFDFLIVVFLILLVNFYNKTAKYKITANITMVIVSLYVIFLFCQNNPTVYGYLFTFLLPPYFIFIANSRKGFFLSISYLTIQMLVYSLNIFNREYTVNFLTRYIAVYFISTIISVIIEWFRDITYKRLLLKNNEVSEAAKKLFNAQKLLEASEEKYRALAENNIDGIAIVRNNKFLYVNPQVCSLLNYSKDELMKKKLSELISEKEIKVVEKHLLKKNISETEPIKLETIMCDSKGTEINVKIQKSNIIFNNNIAYLVIIKDIRERIKLETERLKVSKLKLFETLADGISHDFNNLLTISLGYIDVMQKRIGDDEKTYKYLKKIEDASKRAQSLLDEFKMLSSNELPVKIEEDLNLIVKTTVAKLNAENKNKIKLFFKETQSKILCDKDLITVAVENIVKNGIDAIDSNGEIEIKTEKIFLEKTGMNKIIDHYVLLTITDNGYGIKEEELSRIFDPYFSTKDHVTKKGMGFGLAITQKIISNHHGFIKVNSREGRGTTVSVYLPV